MLVKQKLLKHLVLFREFVVSIISEWFVEAANHCSGAFDRGVSEFELANLTPLPSVRVSMPPNAIFMSMSKS